MVTERTRRRRSDSLGALIRAFTIAYARSFRSALFSLALPLLIVFIGELSQSAHRSTIGSWVIAGIALNTGVFSQGLFGYAVELAHDRDLGVYRRLRCSPIDSWEILVSQLVVQWLGLLLQTCLVIVVVTVGYHASWSSVRGGLAILTLFVTGNVSLFFGQWLCSIMRNARTVTASARLLLLGLVFAEGFFLKLSQWPPILRHFADVMPVHLSLQVFQAVVGALRWNAGDWHDLLGLVAYLVFFGGVSLWRFQWDPS
jgi:hypothetical protein